jgi:hypothetical protein
MHTANIDELKKLPFVHHVPTDERRIFLQPYFSHESNDWHLYIPVGDGKLGRMAGGEPVFGGYISPDPADAIRDFELPLATVITQHLSFPELLGRLYQLESDVHHCASVLEKYHLISARRMEKPLHAGVLITSELEYLILLLRSLYDVLQYIVCGVAKRLLVPDPFPRGAKQLPGSFAEVVLQGDTPRTADEIAKRYCLPGPLADWYSAETPFFERLRGLRDGIAHHGRSVSTVFELPPGLAVNPSDPPWNDFDLWSAGDLHEGRFAPLRLLFASFILHAISTTNRFAQVLRDSVPLPPAVGEGLRSFVRSPYGHWLAQIHNIRVQPWEGL